MSRDQGAEARVAHQPDHHPEDGRRGGWVAGQWWVRRPTNGQAALDVSFIIGQDRRIAFEPSTQEIGELNWHGYVLEFAQDFGRL